MNLIPEQPRLALAPMEGLADDILRDVLTRVGGYDFAVSEFARVSGNRLPAKTFRRISPELLNGGRTHAGTPVRVQILGSDPVSMAESAASLAALDPPAIDLNFGCPTPTVNRHRGGAILLDEPELLYRIVAAVRQNVHVPVTAKMRLGVSDTAKTLDCARALCAGGASEIVVHARTKTQMYRPPADWAWIARIAETVPVPVIANGEVWTVDDYRRCRAESGVAHVMLGRGAVADPFLAQRIRQEVIDTRNGNTSSMDSGASWADLQPLLSLFWQGVIGKVLPRHAPGRLKMWLGYLARRYPEAAQLSAVIRRLRHVEEITHWLHTGI